MQYKAYKGAILLHLFDFFFFFLYYDNHPMGSCPLVPKTGTAVSTQMLSTHRDI